MSDLAPHFVIDGVEIPNVFVNRAVWVRHALVRNPELSQVCDKGMIWMQYFDGYWYSAAGNYSSYSPAEKIRKQAKFEAESEFRLETAAGYYGRVIYESTIRELVLKRDEYTCQLCQSAATSKLHVHHVLKRRQGGTDHLDNLITVCPPCHRKADGALYDPEWAAPRSPSSLSSSVEESFY